MCQLRTVDRQTMNASLWPNTSLDDDSQLQWGEFPQWRVVFSLLVLGYWVLSVLPTIAMSSSVLLAMKKSNPINKSLAIIHTYMLIMNVLIRVCSAVAITTYAPSVIRSCICSTAASSVRSYTSAMFVINCLHL